MEVAIIDWKTVDSSFVKDDLYEHINAPKWVDFSAPDENVDDDDSWFCRPSCNHPKTAEDFFSNEKRRTPFSNSKLQRSASVSDIPPIGGRNKRDATLKRRGMNKDQTFGRVVEDGENQDPNFSTPPSTHKVVKSEKMAIKSSTEKKQTNDDDTLKKMKQTPKLKATLSARNLFSGGGDLLHKVADFCNELKRLAARPRDNNNTNKEKVNESDMEKQENVDCTEDNDKEKERKPLLRLSKNKTEAAEMTHSKGKLRRKKRTEDDIENTPISVNVKAITPLKAEGLLPIQTNPPTPQCFSTTRTPVMAKTPIQARGILQELKSIEKEVEMMEDHEENTTYYNGGELLRRKEAHNNNALDVFWFLKPCTLSN